MRFDPSGQRLFVGLAILRVPEFTEERALEGPGGAFASTAITPDGKHYLTPSDSGEILRWDLDTPRRSWVTTRLELPYFDATWLTRDRGLLIVTTNGDCHEVLSPNFETRPLPQLGNDVHSCALLGESGEMAIARKSGQITLHAADDYALKGTLALGTNVIVRMDDLGKSGVLAAVCGSSFTNRTLQFWDYRKQVRLWEVQLPPVDRGFTVSQREGTLYQIFTDHLIGCDPVHRRTFRRDLDHQNAVRVSFSPDGRWAFSDGRGYNGLLDATTLKTLDRPRDMSTTHGSAFFEAEPRLLLTGCRVFDLNSRRLLLNLGKDAGFTYSPSISPGGGIIAEGLNSRPHLMIWRAPSWEEIRRVETATTP